MLSSGTREESRCHSTHSNSSGDSSSIMADSTISSLSSESFVEIGGSTHKTSASSASFVQLEEDGKEEEPVRIKVDLPSYPVTHQTIALYRIIAEALQLEAYVKFPKLH